MAEVTAPTLTALICSLERSTWSALCTSGSALAPLLSKSPVMIFPGNTLLTSTSTPSVFDMLSDENFKPWKSYTLSHDEVIPLGDGGALIYYRVEALREGQEPFRAICSSCWVKEWPEGGEGEWKMASHQQTLI